MGWEGVRGGGRSTIHRETGPPGAQDSTTPQKNERKGPDSVGRLGPDSGWLHHSPFLLFWDITKLLGLAPQPPGHPWALSCSFGSHCHLS